MTVYVISGPPASGKSSVSQRVAQKTNPCALISGDLVHHMIFFRNPPWVDKGQSELTWRNIACLVRNFVTSGYNVILDYVCYPHEAKWLSSELGQEIKYAVLMAKKETLIKRDSQRENKMGERVLQVYEELKQVDAKHVIYTDELTIEQVANEILMQERFKLSRA